jgi:hypothetical protein
VLFKESRGQGSKDSREKTQNLKVVPYTLGPSNPRTLYLTPSSLEPENSLKLKKYRAKAFQQRVF